jgi:hypothetical protein
MTIKNGTTNHQYKIHSIASPDNSTLLRLNKYKCKWTACQGVCYVKLKWKNEKSSSLVYPIF